MSMSEVASNEVWNFMWQTFENASLTYDLVSSQNVTKVNPDNSSLLENPAKIGILTGFLIACIVNFRITALKFQLDAILEAQLRTLTSIIINTIIFLLLAPLVAPFLTFLFIYRKLVELVLKLQLGDNFAGLLEGTDCVWALEKTSSLSVINVLAVLEKNGTSTNEKFMLNFRNLINDRLVSSSFEKLNWTRHKKYGYFYWRKNENIRLEERVRWIDDDHEKCDGSCDDVNSDYLKKIFAKLTNKSLPRENSTSWEILICKNCEKSSSKCRQHMKKDSVELKTGIVDEKTTIPLLFRVHHSLGDGVALLRLLLESIADSKCLKNDSNTEIALTSSIEIPEAVDAKTHEKNDKKLRIPILRKSSSILETLKEENEVIYYSNYLLSASMPFNPKLLPLHKIVKSILSYIDDRWKVIKCHTANDVTFIFNSLSSIAVNYFQRIREETMKFGKFFVVLISIPNCLVQQTLRSMDNNALHGPQLTGQKILSYWIESDLKNSGDVNLMLKIRDVKNATGTRFGDVILAALSANLYRYFSKIGESAPKNVTVVIPARMTIPSQKLSLQNEFSVGLQKLCISEVVGELLENNISTNFRLCDRLVDVSRSSQKLRKDPDYLINYWVMKWLSAVLPEFLLKPVLESRSTLVFSNLPGPQKVSILGYNLKNVTFWIPHRGTTGIGCSFLTYGEKVHISLIADSAVITSQQFLDEILLGTIDNIIDLYDNLTLSCSAKNLRQKSEAPTKKGLGVP